jgi:hypothetical protein
VSETKFNRPIWQDNVAGRVQMQLQQQGLQSEDLIPKVQSRKQTDKSLKKAVDIFLQQLAEFLELWERVWTGEDKQYGAIYRYNIPECTIIAEYVGEEIKAKLADQREEKYENAKKPYTMIDLSGMAHHLIVYKILYTTCV